MSNQMAFSSLVMRWVVVPSVAIFLAAISAPAQDGNGDYLFLVGSGYLCDTGDSSACPGVVKSLQGDSYEMSGAGALSTQSKSVTATGTFTHKSADGNSLETGVWIATELVSFNSYGIAPGLMRGGQPFGPPPFGPRRSPMLSGPMPAGGLAVFRVRLLALRGLSKTALLQVNCPQGRVPDDHQTEGIRLTIEGGGGEFDQEISGRTLFVLTRPGAGVAP